MLKKLKKRDYALKLRKQKKRGSVSRLKKLSVSEKKKRKKRDSD